MARKFDRLEIGLMVFVGGTIVFTGLVRMMGKPDLSNHPIGLSYSRELVSTDPTSPTTENAVKNAKNLIGDPPTIWVSKGVFFDSERVLVILDSVDGKYSSTLVIHKSHKFYKEWTGLEKGRHCTFTDVGLADTSRPELMASYLAPK